MLLWSMVKSSKGIIDEEGGIDNPKMIPYTISEIFNTEEFYQDTGD